MRLSARGRRLEALIVTSDPAFPSYRSLELLTGIPRSTLHRLLTTDRPVSLATARRFAEAFNIPLEEL